MVHLLTSKMVLGSFGKVPVYFLEIGITCCISDV